MNSLGYFQGFPVYISIHAALIIVKFTKIQRNKLKNKRWVKKYKKKYSYKESEPQAFFDSINKCWYIHPTAQAMLEQRTNSEPFLGHY